MAFNKRADLYRRKPHSITKQRKIKELSTPSCQQILITTKTFPFLVACEAFALNNQSPQMT